jgi:ABC-2 type transport system ATP-binding protein
LSRFFCPVKKDRRTDMSIEVNQISKIYREQKAVDQISFRAEPGKILGFLGPNGAGKSTTMKILTCFIPQTSGDAKVCGFDVAENPMEVRRHIGYLPENNPLYVDMYVKEALSFISDLHQIANKHTRIAEVIELTGLGEEQHKKIGALSKGYRQRVGLAQAIIHNPAVLVLDEPTTGLDPNQIIGIRTLIKELGKSKTVIFSTHIMQEVEAICDQVVIINKGKIVVNELLTDLIAAEDNSTLEQIFIRSTKTSN